MYRRMFNIMIEDGASMPSYETDGSAGCDLRNNLGNDIVVAPGERVFIKTGVHIQLPKGYEAQVRGRSGLNLKHGIVVPTGTIDSDYRGEIGVVVYNLGCEAYIIKQGERIAQLVVSPVVKVEWRKVGELGETERGDGGFGHTGK